MVEPNTEQTREEKLAAFRKINQEPEPGGAKPKSKGGKFIKWAAIGAVVFLGLVIVLVITAPTPPAGSTISQPVSQAQAQTPPPAAPSASTTLNTPPDQVRFYNIITDATTKYNQAANDMAKGAVRHERARQLCAALPGAKAHDWVGQITNLSATGQGNGVLSVGINNVVSFATDNNELSESISDFKTVIPVNSVLFSKVSQMKVGDAVYFSGSFNPNADDCFQEMSLTTDGAMQNPEFLFRFTDVRPAP